MPIPREHKVVDTMLRVVGGERESDSPPAPLQSPLQSRLSSYLYHVHVVDLSMDGRIPCYPFLRKQCRVQALVLSIFQWKASERRFYRSHPLLTTPPFSTQSVQANLHFTCVISRILEPLLRQAPDLSLMWSQSYDHILASNTLSLSLITFFHQNPPPLSHRMNQGEKEKISCGRISNLWSAKYLCPIDFLF